MPGIVVIGVGPGIGRAVAARFAKEGLPVALIARKAETVRAAAASMAGVRTVELTADVADELSLRAALDAAAAELGPPEAVVYNVGVVRADEPGELTREQLLATFSANVGGVLTTAAHVAPSMRERGSGTIIVTGGMPEVKAAYTSLSIGKAGVRAAVDALAEQHGPHGIHVASVTVAGAVEPGTAFDPDVIAEHYWWLHTQPRDAWDREVLHAG
ncbi:SDR family NAD(P)-dependent oxidoreductase [Pseudonocardia sp. TRM90224]|uniref:SDR family NAD(P)-dependent oxidoreductase n=1 Tax=Pseudonocardia sp. TRM90224 TaxID=2812678 RepID=UPI001E4A7D84|nr:SDR family NAD(P)-dependent oxidoreductase [Pseudonocardia sp. TRM90224]